MRRKGHEEKDREDDGRDDDKDNQNNNGATDERPSLVLYGNLDGNEIIAISADTMSVHSIIPLIESDKPYAIDRINEEALLTISRGHSVTEKIRIKNKHGDYKLKHVCVQSLKHSPRTARGNRSGELALVSGASTAESTVLDMTKDCAHIHLEVGDEDSKKGEGAASGIDYGGSNASGHEFWISDTRFAVLNRVKREVQFYDTQANNPETSFFTFNTTTTPHHLLADRQLPGRYYIACEGSPSRFLPPSVFALEENGDSFNLIGQMFLSVTPTDIKKSGGHHLDQVGNLIFMGSAEGYCYIFDSRRLEQVAKIPTGLGHGHTGFIPFQDKIYAVTVNHKDIFTTIIEVDSLTKMGDVSVSEEKPQYEQDKNRTRLAQGHTTFMRMRNGRPFFYLMVSHESKFVEIDVMTRKVIRTLDVANDPMVVDYAPEELYMVQGTLVAEVMDPMMGTMGAMGSDIMSSNINSGGNTDRNNSPLITCTNCH